MKKKRKRDRRCGVRATTTVEVSKQTARWLEAAAAYCGVVFHGLPSKKRIIEHIADTWENDLENFCKRARL